MEIRGKAHLFFEQSAVFKNEFIRLSYDLLYRHHTADLNTPETKGWWDVLCRKFGEGAYVKECMKVACENHPEYDYNEIIVVEK